MPDKIYTIGPNRFYQDRLAFKQRKWIIQELEGLSIDPRLFTDMTTAISSAFTMLSDIGDRLGRIYAIVLIPHGMDRSAYLKEISDKASREARVDYLETHLEEDPEREVWADFLSVNQIGSLLERWTPIVNLAMSQDPAPADAAPPNPSMNSAPCSPEGIPLVETPSLS